MSAAAVGAAEVVGPESFGTAADGTPVERFILSAGKHVVKIITLGATVTEWHAPDRNGQTADVVLGFDDVAGYESAANQSFGCTTGRVCNRIARAQFTVDGKTYQLAVNNPPNHLHGGPKRSLAHVVWKGERTTTSLGPSVKLTYVSPDGEEGYPGNATFIVLYTLTNEGRLCIEWTATTDQTTPVNLTNHSYFNLSGHGAATILDHELQIDAAQYTPVDETLIPTGEFKPVEGTALDFTARPRRIGERISQFDDTPTIGYDHNFVLGSGVSAETPPADGLRRAAVLRDPASGRRLTVWTTQPGVQFYTGNFLNGQTGKSGKVYAHRSACCLETQHFPDSVNQPTFPSILVRPGETYRHRCVYALAAE